MGRNLTNLAVSESFQYLLQISGSEVQDGLGNDVTGSLLITASLANTAVTASYVLNAVSSSYATSASNAASASVVYATQTNANQDHYVTFVATTNAYENIETDNQLVYNPNTNLLTATASFANNATSASFATTASYALNATTNTGSLLTTASAVANVITFTKGDGSTFPVTVATGSAVSASYATTASLALNNVTTASVNSNTITFTKGDGTTFPITVNTGSAVTVNTGSLLVTASINNATTTYTKGDGSTFALTVNNVVNANSASYAATSSYATNFTASNVLITGLATVASASIQNLTVIYETASVIYSSGSNQFGDASNDIQTLWGTVDIKTGPVLVTGSIVSTIGFTGSLLGTASYSNTSLSSSYADTSVSSSFAINATSASYAVTASYAQNANINTGSLLTTASAAGNIVTFTKGDGTTFPVTVATGSAASAFPYTGSAQITGSLAVTGSIVTNSPNVTLGTTYQDTVALGRNAGKDLTGEGYNVLIGADRFGGNEGAGSNLTSGQENTMVGSSAGVNVTDGNQNTIVGSLGMFGMNGSQNTMVGYANGQFGSNGATGNVSMGRWAGYEQNGSFNVLLGWRTGFQSNGNYNVFIGPDVQGQGAPSFTGSNFLAIGSDSTPSNNLLYGYHGTSAQRFLNINGNVNISGSLEGNVTSSLVRNTADTYTGSAKVEQIVTLTQAEYNAIGSPDANTLYVISGSTNPYALLSGSNSFTGNQVFSGSVRGEVDDLTISSNTASLDLSTGNFFTLSLGDGSNTYINPSNILPGQTVNLKITNGAIGTGTVSFPASVKQVSGSAYVPTVGPSAVDVITFISFDSTNLYLSNIKNFV